MKIEYLVSQSSFDYNRYNYILMNMCRDQNYYFLYAQCSTVQHVQCVMTCNTIALYSTIDNTGTVEHNYKIMCPNPHEV